MCTFIVVFVIFQTAKERSRDGGRFEEGHHFITVSPLVHPPITPTHTHTHTHTYTSLAVHFLSVILYFLVSFFKKVVGA